MYHSTTVPDLEKVLKWSIKNKSVKQNNIINNNNKNNLKIKKVFFQQ